MIKNLNLGCYNDIKEDFINLDQEKYFKGIDVVWDLTELPYPFSDDHFEYVYARYVLDHIQMEKRIPLLEELHRICKDKAIIKIIVPYKDKIYKGIDHKGGGFNFYTFPNMCQIKNYVTKKRFKVISQDHKPTKIGKMIPKPLRRPLSHFINEIIEDLIVNLQVIK